MAQFWVYMLLCSDGSLYTGITTDIVRRISQHNEGRASKYTRGRSPVELVYAERAGDRGKALRREAQIKNLSRREKLILCGPSESKSRHSVR